MTNLKIEAGLPNITGSFCHTDNDVTGMRVRVAGTNGCFYDSEGLYSTAKCNSSGIPSADTHAGDVLLDASRSSSIYGNSDTVQPPAIRCYMWRRIN